MAVSNVRTTSDVRGKKLPIKDGFKPIPDLNSLEHRGWNLKHDPDKKLAEDHYFTSSLRKTSQVQPENFLSRRQSKGRGFSIYKICLLCLIHLVHSTCCHNAGQRPGEVAHKLSAIIYTVMMPCSQVQICLIYASLI